MPSNAYNTLLAAIQEVKLWITPSSQTYAQIPGPNQSTAAVPLWSEEFFTHCLAKFNFQNFPAAITYNTVLRTLDEKAQTQPRESRQSANLRAAATKNGYKIDLGGPSVHITGKHWTIEPSDDGAFLRPIGNRPLPHPTNSDKPLDDHLRTAFGLASDENRGICPDPAKALGQWLELALRPNTDSPLLILTGELRDEAAEAIRQLIDPATCAMLPFPTSRNQAGCMALHNRVLAFQIFGEISGYKQSIIRELSQGRFDARLRQTDHKGPVKYEQLGRPIIITAEAAPEITSNQIVIEINKCYQLPQQEVLAALFTQMVRSLCDERQAPEPIPYTAHCQTPQLATAPQSDASVP